MTGGIEIDAELGLHFALLRPSIKFIGFPSSSGQSSLVVSSTRLDGMVSPSVVEGSAFRFSWILSSNEQSNSASIRP